ncbi:putative neuralized-like protein 4-like [Apostichopus japonicus]|uniref:Putative neuralized-like protein 4-like n=1 Tax=Stichopus japonicus TaxID=307972 RepID=A0A2G8KY74_STIJA|nr:putative neuralized-like protein 4-like [Apostichopus japonicus]
MASFARRQSFRREHKFHGKHGQLVKISDNGKNAERLDCRQEFNNGLLFSKKTLRDGECFEVVFEGKVGSWSGSIEIGVTTLEPGSLDIPASATALCEGSWILSGSIVLENGLAETFQTVNVSDDLSDASDSSDSMSDSDDSGIPENKSQPDAIHPFVESLKFHPRHGTAIELSEDAKTAMRRNALSEFDNGVVLTDRPLQVDELFEVKIEKLCHKWSGSLEIGVTSHPPEDIKFPSTMTNMQTGTVLMSGSGILTNGKGTVREYGELSLFELRVNDRIGLTRRSNGDLHFFINGRDQGIAAPNTEETLYGVVDLYGMAEKVSIVESRASILKSLDRRLMHLNYLSSLAGEELPQLFGEDGLFEEPLVFHPICGTNAEVTQNCLLAKMISDTESSDSSIVLSNRHLKTEEVFEFSVESVTNSRPNSFKFGVTTKTPAEIDDLTSTARLGPEVWYIKGASVFHHDRVSSQDYAPVLSNVKKGDRLGLIKKANGELYFFHNGKSLGLAAKSVATHIHAFVQFDSIITGVLALKPDEKSAISLPEEVEPEVPNSEDRHQFHLCHGKNVTLVNNGKTAFRPNYSEEFNFAIVLSSKPLKNGELFEVQLEDMIYRWSGSLVIGVTSQKPEDVDLPSTLTDLSTQTWILSGTSIIHDGLVFNSTFPIDLDQLQVGTRIGLVRHEDGTVDIVLDGEEKYQAFTDVPEEVYGIFDLYGQCCQLTVTQMRATFHLTLPSLEASDSNVSNSSPAVPKLNITAVPGIPHKFHHSCGTNISLSDDCTIASRTEGYDNAVIFSSKPLRPGELFQVKVNKVAKIWSGSLSIGFTKYHPGGVSPRHLSGQFPFQPNKLEDLIGEGLWIMQGSDIKKNGRVVKSNYAPTLERLSIGFTVGVMLTTECTMHIFLNGHDMGLAVADLPKSVYGVLDLYGQVESITVTSSAVNLPEEPLRAPSISSSSSSSGSEEADKETGAELRHKQSLFRFHGIHGQNIALSNENLTAKRTTSFNHGVIFSHKPLRQNQLFEVRIDVLNCHWTSSVKIGVVGLAPEKITLPANVSTMRRSTWVLQEDLVFHNAKKV